MAQYTIPNSVELTKRLYPEGLDSLLIKASPFQGRLKRWTKFGGEGKFLAWRVAPGSGGSASFGVAQANMDADTLRRPLITRVKDYGLASIDGEALDATMGNTNALAEVFKVAIDSAEYNVRRSLTIGGWRTAVGTRGVVDAAATLADANLELTATSSARKFEVGMFVQAVNPVGPALRAGRARISAITRTVGGAVLTTAGGNWNVQIPAIAAGDFIIREGDFNIAPSGVPGWIPDADPAPGDNWFGVDRSLDPVRMAGSRFSPGGGAMDELFIDFASRMHEETGAMPDAIYVNPIEWASLMKIISAKRTVPVPASKPNIAYDAVELYGPAGRLQVFSEPDVPRLRAYFLTMDTWECWSLGDVPKVLLRGVQKLDESTSDGVQVRVGGYYQYVCWEPAANGVLILP